MADDSLKTPVIVRAISLNASSLPKGYSPAYEQYILSQALDFTNVAGKANEAGQGAYDAQVKNDEQDVTLADHETRITNLKVEVDDHEIRITSNTSAISALTIRVTTAEGNITTLQTNLASLTTRVTTAEGNITTIQGDYVSKSVSSNQVVQSTGGSLLVGNIPSPTSDKLQVAGSVNTSTSYKVNGAQVVTSRQTGWTASTGPGYLGAFDSSLYPTISTTYTVSEQYAMRDALVLTRQRLAAVEYVLRAHGLIN
ncbi:phage tail protein [Enterobacter sp. NFIX58]|uniref:phage tail protein n=1 Tax=Enterobacter sp. NFIX58 TaxID=1566251 RepID=UPI0008BC3835|nr:phage tail protein [Enterobacter sp. NFIX58]SEP40015.1 envelope-penetrating protein gp26 [Enterobacter sp. NFIX58]